ncbi:replication endonuclease [Dickeya sp. ws52]|uniref:replication endonuclease n=1 Tax=Dickeya sp. ws52 TaxID=2576377 RepID=UPI00117EC0D4|nr:replication endonuclease [Dickeya sp. ws52]TYL43482.1 replication endonuclease [Dickeya sp. ws52]
MSTPRPKQANSPHMQPSKVKTPESFIGVYPWNAPRPAIGPDERALTRDELHQGQAVLSRLHTLPRFLAAKFRTRFEFLKKNQGLHSAFRYLVLTVERRLWPRIDAINQRHGINQHRALDEFDSFRYLPDMSDASLKKFARRVARQVSQAYEVLSDGYLAEHGPDNSVLFTDTAQHELYGKIAGMSRTFNVRPLYWRKYRKGKLTMRDAFSALSRLCNEEWWERQLKAQRARWREAFLIAIGDVNKDISPYASAQAIRDVRARRLANLDFLKSCEVENTTTGERFDLIDKVMASISNPEIRRMELMSTIAGIERYAGQQGHVGMFVTITTPSKYHPTRIIGKARRVQFNRSWDKEAFTPKDGQRYLVRVWSLMRTAFKDNDLQVYGMRVVEPHHDGTPHWHMMLFCRKEQRQHIIDIMRRYALKEDGGEPGAWENRFDCKHLNKGGAAGYIAKYIAKNIDGYALDGELDKDTGKPLKDTAAAVMAWAATWRIPQFHPIGIPTMGAYRECRRIRDCSLAEQFDEQVEAVRAAADIGDFAAYIGAQGGANVPRDQQTLRVARTVAANLNAYDEEVQKVIGIFSPRYGFSHVFTTRADEWRIVPKAIDVGALPLKSGSAAPRSPVNNCGWADWAPGENRIIEVGNRASDGLSDPLPVLFNWNDSELVASLAAFARAHTPRHRTLQQPIPPSTDIPRTPSARLSMAQRQQLARLQTELQQKGIQTSRQEREALLRGATLRIDGEEIRYQPPDDGWEW